MATKELRIVTNNGWIEKGPAVPHEIIPVDGTPLEVLDKAEELLQQGIEKNDRQYDKDGLIAIDKARERYRMERENHNLPEPGEDFGVIDRQMLQRMLRDTMLIEAEKEN